MRRPLLMPKLGLTMTEGTVVEWTCPVGTSFKEGDSVFVVETDKVANEIPADASGVLTEIIAEAGQTVSVGEVVGYWEDAREASMAGTSEAGSTRGKPETAPPARGTSSATLMESLQTQRADEVTPMRVRATPLARRLAREFDVELQNIHGTGPDASIKARDIHAAVAARVPGPAPIAGASPPGGSTSNGRTRFRPNAAQTAMAQRLTAVKQEVPHFYLAVDVQVTCLLALRSELNASIGPTRLSLNHFVVAAVGRALADCSHLNQVWSDGEIVRLASTDVGVAVHTARGLYVPIVRDVGRVDLREAARRIQSQVERARAGTLASDDLAGGAITVSNAGMFNVRFMTPIINPGHAMTLGVGSISGIFRPDEEGRPVLKDEMGLVLAADHRILDGVHGLEFLNCVVDYLENPMKLLSMSPQSQT